MALDLPPEVLALLRDRIPGPSELEVLLAMRNDVTQRWTAAALAARLGLPEAWVLYSLEALCAAGLVATDTGTSERRYHYDASPPAADETVAVLARIYRERPADVIRVLTENAISRVRVAATQAFAAAFLVPRPKT